MVPELDGVGHEPVPAPERRARHLLAELCGELGDALLEHLPALDALALPRRPRAELARPRPVPPVALRFLAADAQNRSAHPHLALGRPEEHECGTGVGGQVAGLGAGVVRVEDEPGLVDALEQDHASRGHGVGRGRHERHRLGDGVAVPGAELCDRILLDVVLVEPHGAGP